MIRRDAALVVVTAFIAGIMATNLPAEIAFGWQAWADLTSIGRFTALVALLLLAIAILSALYGCLQAVRTSVIDQDGIWVFFLISILHLDVLGRGFVFPLSLSLNFRFSQDAEWGINAVGLTLFLLFRGLTKVAGTTPTTAPSSTDGLGSRRST